MISSRLSRVKIVRPNRNHLVVGRREKTFQLWLGLSLPENSSSVKKASNYLLMQIDNFRFVVVFTGARIYTRTKLIMFLSLNFCRKFGNYGPKKYVVGMNRCDDRDDRSSTRTSLARAFPSVCLSVCLSICSNYYFFVPSGIKCL